MDEAKVFTDVKFVLAECNDPNETKRLLLEGGAKHINYLSDVVTHVIADTNCPEAEEAVELFDKPVVTSLWVHLCLKAKALLPPEAFSPTRRIFDGVITAFSKDLSQNDIETLAATITFYGGRVSKNLSLSTHFIAISAKPSDFSENATPQNTGFKLVAPDWVLDSIKQMSCCDEAFYGPSLLNGPPPPTPPPAPTPPPPLPQQQHHHQPQTPVVELTQQLDNQSKDKDLDDSIYRPEAHNVIYEQANSRIEVQAQATASQRLTNPSQTAQQRPIGQQQSQQGQIQTTLSQLPRPRMSVSVINRGPGQPRFRPILPPNQNQPMNPRQSVQMTQTTAPRPMGPDQRKIPIDYNNSYRKMGPYQNGPDMQHMPQPPPPTGGPYHTVQHLPMQQQHQSNLMAQHPPSRIPPPNVYHQPRGPYQNNQMAPRMSMNQPQMMNQPMQQVDRFQDPGSQMQPRPYQVYSHQQQQPLGNSYPQGVMQRPPTYYAQGPTNHMPIRPQQVPISRPMMQGQGEPNFQDGYSQAHLSHHEAIPMQPNQSQYQPQQHQPSYQHQGHQSPHMPIQQTSQQHHPSIPMQQSQQFSPALQAQMVVQPRQQLLQPNMPAGPLVGVRGPRMMQPSQPQQQEIKQAPIRQPPASHVVGSQQTRAPKSSVAQPHPSIFDNKHETNLVQLRAKVPSLTENIKYFGHDPNFKVPNDLPLAGCRFKMIEYHDVHIKDRMLWSDAIEDAGGSFIDDESKITHLICETRNTDECLGALKKGIRCVTVYWINDVLARNHLSYPWKALHFPKWYKTDEKPLKDHMISVTNIKGRERREVIEMIIKTGATYTDSFCQKNTLLICGSPGGEKYERAIVWRTPITNCQILVDFIVGESKDFSSLLPLAKYQNFNRPEHLILDSYSNVRELMLPWTKPIPAPPFDAQEIESVAIPNGTTQDDKLTNIQSSEDSGIATSGSGGSACNNSDGDGNNKFSSCPLAELGHTREKGEIPVTTTTTQTDGDKILATSDKSVNQARQVEKDMTDLASDDKNADQAVAPISGGGDHADNDTTISMETSDIKEGTSLRDSSKLVQDIEEDRFVDCKETQSSDLSSSGVKSDKINGDTAATTKQVSAKLPRTSKEPVRILFTRLERKLVSELQSYAVELNLGIASSPNDCTHLVVDRISRTPKFICSLNHAQYILNYKWLIESYEAKQVLDEKAFMLQDPEGEEKFSFNLVHSLLKRKRRAFRPLFNNFIFFVTPSIISKVANLKEMIESAGGTMITRKLPTKVQLNQMRTNGKRFIVVTNQQDLYIVSSIRSLGVDIVGSEFIMSGILRQDIDFEAHRMKTLSVIAGSVTQRAVELVQPSPSKKLRAE